MAKTTKALEEDCLCAIAVRHGFADCGPLRALPANSAFASKPPKKGEEVALPETTSKQAKASTGGTANLKIASGPALLRFVHGSANLPYHQDPAFEQLEISNFVTDKGGASQGAKFPTSFGFNADGHADPDTFKLEVTLSGAPDPLKVKLEALRPQYGADGKVTGHVPFAGAPASKRELEIECKRVGVRRTVYRSRYLRLVSDDVDQAVAPAQALLVTDVADGTGGADDKVEILDQLVRASLELPLCKASPKCVLQKTLPLAEEKRRVRLCVHVFRATPGGSAVGGLTKGQIRRRILKWFRRAYAQAALGPRIVAPEVEFIEPPSADMLVFGQDTGARTSGLDSAGNPSTLTFKLGLPPGGAPAPEPTVTVNLVPGMTPTMVAGLAAASLPAGFTARVVTNARAFNAADPSCDVIVSRTDGKRVMIRNEGTTDTAATVLVARVNLSNVDDSSSPNLIPTTPDFRRVLHSAPGSDDRLDYFIIDRFQTFGLRGRAFVPATDLAGSFRPPQELRWAVVMALRSSSGAVMDGGDNLPFTFPHESGHVLSDAFHAVAANSTTEMMTGSGTSAANSVTASKRICDNVHVKYQMFDPTKASPTFTEKSISAVSRFRTRGAPVFEDW